MLTARPAKKARRGQYPGRTPYNLYVTERFDVARARYLARHYDQFPELHQDENDRQQLLGILKRGRGRNGSLDRVLYTQQEYAYGRLYAQGASLQRLNKIILHTIAAGLYDDIDMVNAHPVILSQYLVKKGIRAPATGRYASDRRDCIQEFTKATRESADVCKETVLAVLNGGQGPHWHRIKGKAPKWLHELVHEVGDIIHPAVRLHEPALWKDATVRVDTEKDEDAHVRWNVGGRACSRLCQKIEHKGLMAMMTKCQELGILQDWCIPQFDGIKIPRVTDPIMRAGLLRHLEVAILEHTGYEIKLAFKAMDKGLALPDDLTPKLDGLPTLIEDEDNQAADVFYEMVSNDVRMCKGEIFVRQGGIWVGDSSNETTVKRFLLDKCARATRSRGSCSTSARGLT